MSKVHGRRYKPSPTEPVLLVLPARRVWGGVSVPGQANSTGHWCSPPSLATRGNSSSDLARGPGRAASEPCPPAGSFPEALRGTSSISLPLSPCCFSSTFPQTPTPTTSFPTSSRPRGGPADKTQNPKPLGHAGLMAGDTDLPTSPVTLDLGLVSTSVGRASSLRPLLDQDRFSGH